ncbi:hypothetical protein N2152v2_005438 [Parachlorella kessleri]
MKVWQCYVVLVALLCNRLGAAGQRLFVSRDEFVQQQWQQQQPRRSLRAVVDLPGVPGYSAPAYYGPSTYGSPVGLVPYYSVVSGRRLSSTAGDVWSAPELSAGRQLKEYGAVVSFGYDSRPAVYSASLPLYSATTPLPYYSPVVTGRRLTEVPPMPTVPLFAPHDVPKPRQTHSLRSLQAAAAPAPAFQSFFDAPVVTSADTRGAPRTLLQAYYTAQPYSAYPSAYASAVVVTQSVYAPAVYAAVP